MLNQTYQDFEYIIVDGGSTDGTINIINEYMPKFHGKMKMKSEPDKGIYDAMNKGIKRCSGDLIGMVNSDDWYEDNTLELVSKARTQDDYQVIYGMQRTIKDEKEKSIVLWNHEFLPEQMITHPTCFVTKKAYEDLGDYNSDEYRSSADYELMLRYYMNKKGLFAHICG